MANNVTIGPNALVAKVDVADINTTPLSDFNTKVLYEVEGGYKSWSPTSVINAINGLRKDVGYLLIAKIDMDLNQYFAPLLPVSTGGGGVTPVVVAGADQDLPGGTVTTALSGTATPATGHTISSVRWVTIQWPAQYAQPTFTTGTSLNTNVNGLRTGTYLFQLQATDEAGNIGVGQTSIVVQISNAIQVNAGVSQELDEGVSTANLYGSINITGVAVLDYVQWSVVTPGATGIVFSTPENITTGVTGIPVATTGSGNINITFRLTAYDTIGNAYNGDVVVTSLKPSVMFKTAGWDSSLPGQMVWIYQPQGYDVSKPGGYPATLFLHGQGENGDESLGGVPNDNDPNVLLRESAGLPYFIYNKLYPMKSVVIMPHLYTGFWDITAAQKAINYALNNYNLDANYISVTGLSSGGRGTFDVCEANPNLFSAGIPICPVFSNVGNGAGAVVKDIPFFVVTSYGDETGAPPNADGNAFDAIDSICAASPKGLFPPRVLCAWDTGHDPQTWNWLVYDKRRAVFDFEKDFFLLHSKVYLTTVTNYVVRAEQSKTFYDWSLAAVQLDRLAAGTPKTQLQTRMNTVLNQITTDRGHVYTMLNLGSTGTCPYYTINNAPSCAAGASVTGLKNIKNVNVPYTFTVTTNTSTTPGTDGISHNEMGMHSSMFSTYFRVGGSNWVLGGLDPAKQYDFYVYCSDRSQSLKSSGIRTGCEISFNNHWTQLNFEGWNTQFTAQVYGVQPDGSGNVAITANALWGNGGVVNAILIRERAISDNRLNKARFNFAKTPSGVDGSEYGILYTDPTVGTSVATDPKSGWKLETVGTAPPYWNKVYDEYYADDEVMSAAAPGSFTPMVGVPEVVARSAWFNEAEYFNDETPNYNLRCVGTPGMGFREGLYQAKFYSASTNTEATVSEFTCKFTSGGIQQIKTTTDDNFTGKYVTFTGRMKEGDFMRFGLFMPNIYGFSFLNYLEIERVED
jgi:hypothetical protein